MQSASNITNLNEYEDVVDKVRFIENNVLTLQSYTVSKGTNFGVGPSVFQDLTTGTQNTGNGAGGGTYGLTTGSRNVMVGYNSGGGCQTGSNNTFLGANTQFKGGTYINGSIDLGEGAVVNGYNQLMVASNVTSFNISGLTPSTGSREGTILEFDSSGNIIPSAGTYNSVSKIYSDFSSLSSSVSTNTSKISSLQSQVSTNTTDIGNLQNYVSLTGLFIPTFSSESDCTATAINSGYSYYRYRFLNCYMLFSLDVTATGISSFSVDVSSFPATFNTSITPTAVISVSGPSAVSQTSTWTFSGGNGTLNLTFTGFLVSNIVYVATWTYTISLHTWGLVLNPP